MTVLEYIRIGCAVPHVQVGNPAGNVKEICSYMEKARDKNVDVLVFPELAVTGYSCGDLFFQNTLLQETAYGMEKLAACSAQCPSLTAAVGLPVEVDGQLFNCAAVFSAGRLEGIAVKTFLPNYNEFSERRWFSPADQLTRDTVDSRELGLSDSYPVPIGRDLLFEIGEGTKVGVEICEDLWTPVPPSALLAMQGVEVILNLSASNEVVGKRKLRRDLVTHQSASGICVYAYCSAGSRESGQDLIFSGHSMVAAHGMLLAENENQADSGYLLVQDADLGMVRADRRKNKTFQEGLTAYGFSRTFRTVRCSDLPLRSTGHLFPLRQLPFVPEEQESRLHRCREIFGIQVSGLKRRLEQLGCNLVIGISGGLDSTLALLVAAEAMHRCGRPMTDIYGVTMPCFGTSDRTYRNALELMRVLGISEKEISIREAMELHFRDIGHDIRITDGTYENAQARERTQVLMDYASRVGGIVVGTGDLSELALGWCTYNGDHMSMYGVNASVPKTLIRWMIEAIAEEADFTAAKEVLRDILDTPISPELLPPEENGAIRQQTEEIVGPYALHDFYLFYMLRYGFSPTKIYIMACRAFSGEYTPAEIKKWLCAFYRRFFSQQFKRNCLPDGIKVGSVALGSRSDWRMPSDACADIWLKEAEAL